MKYKHLVFVSKVSCVLNSFYVHWVIYLTKDLIIFTICLYLSIYETNSKWRTVERFLNNYYINTFEGFVRTCLSIILYFFSLLVATFEVSAVLGRTARLPCDIEPSTREDRVYMVLWFRDDAVKPIYRYRIHLETWKVSTRDKYLHDECLFSSFDVRGRSFNKALNWSDSTVVGPRAYFVTMTKPATLSLEAVQLDDEGIYRCRVDFKNSPTKNFQVNLTVIGRDSIILKKKYLA